MGLFGFKSDKKTSSHGMSGWLQKVDSLYDKAMQTKDMSGLEKYLDRSCYRKISEKLRMCDKVYSGIDRYKHVSWEKVNNETYIKHVTYDQMSISKGIQAKVGDDYNEEWFLVSSEDGTRVKSIRRIA